VKAHRPAQKKAKRHKRKSMEGGAIETVVVVGAGAETGTGKTAPETGTADAAEDVAGGSPAAPMSR
jgi:hypothetical protein